MGIDYRVLDITFLSAKNLNIVNRNNVYAVVTVSGGDRTRDQKIKSWAAQVGDAANPTWNFPIKFDVVEEEVKTNRLMLDFKLVRYRNMEDEEAEIGQVNVSMKQLSETSGNYDDKTLVCFPVRNPNGRYEGQIYFSYKFIIGGAPTYQPLMDPYKGEPSSVNPPPALYPFPSNSVYPPPNSTTNTSAVSNKPIVSEKSYNQPFMARCYAGCGSVYPLWGQGIYLPTHPYTAGVCSPYPPYPSVGVYPPAPAPSPPPSYIMYPRMPCVCHSPPSQNGYYPPPPPPPPPVVQPGNGSSKLGLGLVGFLGRVFLANAIGDYISMI